MNFFFNLTMSVLCYLNISWSNKVENVKIKEEENASGRINEIWDHKDSVSSC